LYYEQALLAGGRGLATPHMQWLYNFSRQGMPSRSGD
jgi:hypothetical protein